MIQKSSNEAILYDSVNPALFKKLQQTYDTEALLYAVDSIERLTTTLMEDGGGGEALLRLHSMLKILLYSGPATMVDDRMPALARDLSAELVDGISTLRRILTLVSPIAQLPAK